MSDRLLPLWLRRAPSVDARGFALLSGVEATVRGILITVLPLSVYRAFPDTGTVSKIYFVIGLLSLLAGLMVPQVTRVVPRRYTYSIGVGLFVLGNTFAIIGGRYIIFALFCHAIATVTCFVCLNAYVLDYVSKVELGRTETLRIFYSALAWAVGPVAGVWLLSFWRPAPFIVSMIAAIILLAVFWYLRLGDGKLIARARQQAPNPLAYLGRFFAQPRLIGGWLFAVLRHCGWWTYVVYLPIFALQMGLGDKIGGTMQSTTNMLLFATPLLLRWIQRRTVRFALRTGFLFGGLCLIAATLAAHWLPLTLILLFLASICLVLLDMTAGLPFLLAVKPSERSEMSAIYSSFRDVSGIVSPGVTWAVLQVAPLAAVFSAVGLAFLFAWSLAGRLHPQLGIMAAERARMRRVQIPQ